VHILVLVSDDAVDHIETLTVAETNVIQSGKISSPFKIEPAVPPPYKNNGVFNAPDYHGYISVDFQELTYAQTCKNKAHLDVSFTLIFSSNVESTAKVMIMIVGVDSAGQPAFSPISESQLFQAPEYAIGGLAAFGACFAGFAAFKKYSKNPPLTR